MEVASYFEQAPPCTAGLYRYTPPLQRAPRCSAAKELRNKQGGKFSDVYILRARLGDGCSGEVFVAQEKKSNRRWACKLARRDPSSPARDWQMFVAMYVREAELLQQCAHPAVVGFADVYHR